MMRTLHLYDVATGIFSGQSFSTNDIAGFEEGLRLNTPPGHATIEGDIDHLSQAVDLKTGEIIDYRPPAPDSDHEWNSTTRRWQLKPEVQELQQKRAAALAEISALEAQQPRAIRELLLDPDNVDAKAKLQIIDRGIEDQRELMAAATVAVNDAEIAR